MPGNMTFTRVSRTIKARDILPGMNLVFGKDRLYVDEVEFTRDGEVLVRVGVEGTGTEFYKMNDLVNVAYYEG